MFIIKHIWEELLINLPYSITIYLNLIQLEDSLLILVKIHLNLVLDHLEYNLVITVLKLIPIILVLLLQVVQSVLLLLQKFMKFHIILKFVIGDKK